MRTFTRQDVLSWKPCHGEAETLRIMRGLPRMMTALDVLRHEAATHADRLWCVLREEIIDAKTLRLFACWSARRALQRERDAGREPDARSWAAVEVAERFARGEATSDELSAARAAARDSAWDAKDAAYAALDAARVVRVTRNAAWATAMAAAGTAGCDAEDAALVAARAAARAAAWYAAEAAAAWDAERAAQVEHLLAMLEGEGA